MSALEHALKASQAPLRELAAALLASGPSVLRLGWMMSPLQPLQHLLGSHNRCQQTLSRPLSQPSKQVVERCALSVACVPKQRGFGVHLGGGDHLKGLPRLSQLGSFVDRRPVVAEGA